MDKNIIDSTEEIKDSIKDIQKELFFLKKVEKLTSALYKVTDLIPNEEPLKWRMRNEALNLLSATMSFIDDKKETTSGELSDVLYGTSRVISLLEVSFIGSFVSQMNFSILKDEYRSLRNSIHEYKHSKETSIPLAVSKDELDEVHTAYLPNGKREIFIKDIYKGQDIGISKNGINNSEEYNFRVGHIINKRHPQSNKSLQTSSLSRVLQRPRSSEDKEKRRKLILNYIKDKGGEVSIKDILEITYLSKTYSEKTIQRELVDMVNHGVLKKKGERRWSRYYI